MKPKPYKARLDRTQKALSSALKELEKLRHDLEREMTRSVYFMNKNSDLWLQLSKLPGGLEQARRIGRDASIPL